MRAVPVRGRVRGQLAHPLDGRYGAMDTSTLNEHIRRLLDATVTHAADWRLVEAIERFERDPG